MASSPWSSSAWVQTIRSCASNDDLQPYLVERERLKGALRQAGVFVVADAVFDVRALAVAALDDRDLLVGLIGEDRLDAVAVAIGKAQLRAGVRALTSNDDSRALRPRAELDVVGDLCDLAVVALAAVLRQRRNPRVGGRLEDRRADRLGQLVADREADLRLAAVVDQAVRCAGRVGAHEDLDLLDVLAGDLLERAVKQRDVIGRGIRAGVSWPQHAAERLTRLIGA